MQLGLSSRLAQVGRVSRHDLEEDSHVLGLGLGPGHGQDRRRGDHLDLVACPGLHGQVPARGNLVEGSSGSEEVPLCRSSYRRIVRHIPRRNHFHIRHNRSHTRLDIGRIAVAVAVGAESRCTVAEAVGRDLADIVFAGLVWQQPDRHMDALAARRPHCRPWSYLLGGAVLRAFSWARSPRKCTASMMCRLCSGERCGSGFFLSRR